MVKIQRINPMRIISMSIIALVFTKYCIAQKVDTLQPLSQKVRLKVFPNPVKNKAVFRLFNYEAGAVNIQITDAIGNIVYNEKRLVVMREDEITVFFQLKSGIYRCVIRQMEKVAKISFSVIY